MPEKDKVVKPIPRPVPEKAKNASIGETLKAETLEKEREKITLTGVEEKQPIGSEKEISPKEQEKKILEKEAEKEFTGKEASSKGEAGYYIVKAGDTLPGIAAKEEVYGDPLKWPLLCRLNLDKFADMEASEDSLAKQLPAGLRLKIYRPEEVLYNLKERANSPWVVNVLSSTRRAEIIPAAIKLVLEGYPVYITRAKVEGKNYMRLRVGFFEKKAEADAEGKKIMAMLKLPDSWTNRVGKKEFQRFGGY